MLGHYVEEILVLPNGSLNAPRVVALVSSKKGCSNQYPRVVLATKSRKGVFHASGLGR